MAATLARTGVVDHRTEHVVGVYVLGDEALGVKAVLVADDPGVGSHHLLDLAKDPGEHRCLDGHEEVVQVHVLELQDGQAGSWDPRLDVDQAGDAEAVLPDVHHRHVLPGGRQVGRQDAPDGADAYDTDASLTYLHLIHPICINCSCRPIEPT